MNNLYWRDIKTSDIVEWSEYGWKVNGSTVYWVGSETIEAHRFLQCREVKTSK